MQTELKPCLCSCGCEPVVESRYVAMAESVIGTVCCPTCGRRAQGKSICTDPREDGWDVSGEALRQKARAAHEQVKQSAVAEWNIRMGKG